MEITDLSGLGKPLEKFLEVVSKGIGRLYSDTFGLKADSQRIKLLGEAKADLVIYEKKNESEYEVRASIRNQHTESNRQKNIEQVLSLAYEGLPNAVSETDVDEDWITRYFETIKDVSNEKLKIVWAKILTGEIKSPGSFSLRTIEVIKNISSDEAEIFQKICEFTSGYRFIIKPKLETDFKKYGINHHDLMIMVECGLVRDASFGHSDPEYRDNYPIPFPNTIILLNHSNIKRFSFSLLLMSKAGIELSRLLQKDVDEEYLKDLVAGFESNGFQVEIKYERHDLG